MLSPERKQHIADGSEYIASLLHEEIVKIVAEAIVTRMERGVEYRLTARDRWLLELLQDAGYMRQALEKEIAAKTRLMLREVQAAFEDAAVESVAWDDAVYAAAGLEPLPLRQSPMLMRLAERGYQKTKGELVNFTGTLADASQRLFIRECDKAYTLVSSGVMSHAQAVRQAVDTAASEGVIVRYPSGHRDTIETATGRAVRTGVGQACGDMTLARMDELKWDIVLVSSHLGARTGDGGDNWTNHYYLQSVAFFSRNGNDKRFKPLSVCGIGYVDGLLGANCRHSIGPGDGVHNPYAHYDSEENRLREELEQRQRLLERRVRDTKRKVQGLKAAMDKAKDPADREELWGRYQQAARKLQQQNRAYNEFCQANDLKPYRERLHIAGWDRKQASAATGAARAAEKAAAVQKRLDSFDDDLRMLRENGTIKTTGKPVVPPPMPENMQFNPHAEMRAAERGMTIEDAHSIASKAPFAIRQRNGKQNVFFTDKGFVAVGADGTISSIGPLDDGGVAIMEVAKRHGFG